MVGKEPTNAQNQQPRISQVPQSSLRDLTLHGGQGFQLISTRDQRYLHDFFRPSEELTETELLAHRREITARRPSLPACAGRALRHFANPKRKPGTPMKNGKHLLYVYALARPQIGLDKLARALILLARRDLGLDPVTGVPRDGESGRRLPEDGSGSFPRHSRTDPRDEPDSNPRRRAG